MRRSILAASVLVALASAVPSHAAANTAVAAPGSFVAGYATPRLVIQRSLQATFVNLDVEPHDIRSVENKPGQPTKPLWSSAVIEAGETSVINGLAGATVRDYEFYCSVHTNMRGVATIVA